MNDIDITEFRRGVRAVLTKQANVPPGTPALPLATPTHYWAIDPRRYFYEKPALEFNKHLTNTYQAAASAPAEQKEQLFRGIMNPEQQRMYDQGKQLSGTMSNFTNDQGNFDMGKTWNTISSGAKNLLGQEGEFLGGMKNHLMNGNWGGMMDTVKQSPWLAGGTAALGAAGLYGAGKLAGGLFGGGGSKPKPLMNQPQPQQQQGLSTSTPQSFEKYSEFKFPSPLSIPQMAAGAATGQLNIPGMSGEHRGDSMAQQPYNPHIHTDNRQLQQTLKDPRMREYITNLVQQVQGNNNVQNT